MVRTAVSHAPRGAAGKPLAANQQSMDVKRAHWGGAFRRVRAETERRAAPLSAEDQIVQSMADASPTKWHRAHVTWFFEQFLLVPHDPAYKIFDRALSVPVQFLLRRRRPAPCAPAARPDHAAERRRRRRLSRACRCGGRAVDRRRAGGGRRARLRDPGDRPASRAAASGTAAHRHPARLRAEPDRSGLRRGLAAAARRSRSARFCRRAGRHSCRSVTKGRGSASTTRRRGTTN